MIIERERTLLHLPEAVDDININRLLFGRFRCVVKLECFFLQWVQVIGQEHRAVVHFQRQCAAVDEEIFIRERSLVRRKSGRL